MLWQGVVECACGCDGEAYVVQWSNCSIHTTLDCDGCPEPCDGGGRGRREPMAPTIAENHNRSLKSVPIPSPEGINHPCGRNGCCNYESKIFNISWKACCDTMWMTWYC